MQIEQSKTNDLIPFASNSRTHSDEQVAQIAASIKEFGFNNPILLDGSKGVIAGHGRLLAARKLGLDKIPTIKLDHLTDAQRRAYIIADNKLALNAGWDVEMLALEMGDLSEAGFDLSLIGFNEDELANILIDATEGLTDPDDVPELTDDPVTKPGDVWVLGKHRLRCGDSTDADAVAALLGDVKPHLMVTDPPYGVEYDPEWRDIVEKEDGRWNKNNVTTRALGQVENDDRSDWSEAWALFPGDVAYVWHASCFPEVQTSLIDAGFSIRSQIIWVKQSFVFSRGHYHWQHEPCWYAVRKGNSGKWSGDRKQSTVWEIRNNAAIGDTRKNEEATGHGTQKPVECMKRPIENNSSPGQAVYEPFSGSGTTIIAGEITGRKIYAMELSPEYVDLAVKRWQDFTGEQATLEATGDVFPNIKDAAV